MIKWFQKNICVLVVIGACILVISFFKDKEDYVKEYNAKIKALDEKIDSLHNENAELDRESILLREKIKDYNIRITKLNAQIDVIKDETQQQVDNVDTFGDDELEQFFTDRYKSKVNN